MAAVAPVRRAALAFVFVTVALDMLALGVIIPVWPTLVKSFTGASDADASLAIGAMSVVWAVAQFFAAPVIGILSDRFGRRPVILASNLGTAADYVIMGLAPTLPWLYIGRALSGTMSASVTAATAYIADVTPAEKRAGAFGMLGAAFGLGFVIGPAVGGWLGSYDPRLPFWGAAVLSGANFLYGLVVLPESLAPENRRKTFDWRKANPLGALRLLRSHRELFGIAAVAFIGYIAHEVYPTIYVLYGEVRYGWSTATLGIGLAIVGVMSAIVSAGLSQKAVDKLGTRRALIGGLLIGGSAFALYGSPSTFVFWLAIPLNSLWGIAGSAEQVIMTSRVGPDEQGELQGALGAMRSIAMIAAPMMFSGVFAFFLPGGSSGIELPGAPWYLAGVLVVGSIAIAWPVTSASRRGS